MHTLQTYVRTAQSNLYFRILVISSFFPAEQKKEGKEFFFSFSLRTSDVNTLHLARRTELYIYHGPYSSQVAQCEKQLGDAKK